MSRTKRGALPRSRGPRPKDENLRAALLDAGRQLHAEAGFNAVPLRAVSERAGANQAMIRYYFRDKHGFEHALLDDSFDRLIAAAGEPSSLEAMLERLIGALDEMPWLPILLAKSVYFSTELRAHFAKAHAPRLVGALRQAIPAREGLDPGLAALSVLSMLMFPQIARPVVERVFGVAFDGSFARAYASHVAALFPAVKTSRETKGRR